MIHWPISSDDYLRGMLVVEESNPSRIRDYAYFGELDRGVTVGTVMAQHRDSDALDRSNFESFQLQLEVINEEHVYIERDSHWAVGWVERLDVQIFEDGRITPTATKAFEILDGLQSHPIVDDDHFSELEYEEFLTYWDEEIPWRFRDCEEISEDLEEFSSWLLDKYEESGLYSHWTEEIDIFLEEHSSSVLIAEFLEELQLEELRTRRRLLIESGQLQLDC